MTARDAPHLSDTVLRRFMAEHGSVTQLLAKATPGDPQTIAALVPLVYAELRMLATSYLAGDRPHTLQPTALVHEAFLKMVGDDRGWSGIEHFKAVAAIAMRQVLVDHARGKNALKRGGGRSNVAVETLDDLSGCASPADEGAILELDDLLATLARSSARAARVAELRLFGGMAIEEIALVEAISPMTVKRDWQVARAWLASQMQERGRDG